MSKIKLSIKNRFTGSIIFEYEKEDNTILETVKEYVRVAVSKNEVANLRYADLSYANLRYADLRSIKNDLFTVLLHGIKEVPFLRENIINGNIDGSTYEGPCACLSGTLENAAIKNNGTQQKERVQSIIDVRDSYRPIERFFLAINKGDTPETNNVSKIVLEWVDEFQTLIKNV